MVVLFHYAHVWQPLLTFPRDAGETWFSGGTRRDSVGVTRVGIFLIAERENIA
jgi:hypothetical protein